MSRPFRSDQELAEYKATGRWSDDPQSFGPGSGIAGLGGGYGGYGGGYGDPYRSDYNGGYGGNFAGAYDPYGGYGGGNGAPLYRNPYDMDVSYDPGPARSPISGELPPTTQPALPPPTEAAGEAPYMSGAQTSTVSRDPALEQLLFGLDGEGGFIPGAMQAAENTFFNPDGTPRVVDQEVAGFSPDQQRAMELARGQVGMQDRYLTDAESAYEQGVNLSDQGLQRQRELGVDALGSTQRGVLEEQALRDRGLEGLLSSIGESEDIQRGAVDQFGQRLTDVESMGTSAADRFSGRLASAEQRGLDAVGQLGSDLSGIESLQRGATEDFGSRLGESEALIRGTTGAYDQDLTKQFYDPYEDRVVSQTIEDAMEGGAKADMAQFAQDVSRGGESAFGSRARLTAGERREDLGRGLAKELAGIRSRGLTEAQRAGTSEFARQKAAEGSAGSNLANLSGQRLGSQQQLASGLGSLSGQRFGAETGAADRLTSGAQQRLGSEQGVVDLYGRTGGQQLAAQQGLGSGIANLGQAGQQALSQAGQSALGSAGQLAGAQGQFGSIQGQIGQQQLQSRAGLGGFMQNLGGQAQQAGLAGINALAGFGGQQQQLAQQQLNAQRQNQLTAQQAPMAQYQSLLPFMQAVPAGQQTSQQTFTPAPSPVMAGLGTGLSALGGIGSFMNQGRYPQPYYQPQQQY